MPAASRADMQAECGKALLIRIRQSNKGTVTVLKQQPLMSLVKSAWCLPMSGAVDEGSVTGPFCLDEKHHRDLDETS